MFKGWKANRLKKEKADKDAVIVSEVKEGESKVIAETTEPVAR